MIILGDKYTIKRKRKGKRHWAHTDVAKREIVIDSSLTGSAYRDILGHEIMHVFLAHGGLEGFLTQEQVEALCDSLGRSMMVLIEENFQPKEEE